MTPEEILAKYNDTEPVIGGQIREVRISPNGLRLARRVPFAFTRDDLTWISLYFIEHVGLTVALLSDEDVADWLVLEVKG